MAKKSVPKARDVLPPMPGDFVKVSNGMFTGRQGRIVELIPRQDGSMSMRVALNGARSGRRIYTTVLVADCRLLPREAPHLTHAYDKAALSPLHHGELLRCVEATEKPCACSRCRDDETRRQAIDVALAALALEG